MTLAAVASVPPSFPPKSVPNAWLDAALKTTGVTNTELARRIGIKDVPQISKWRRGRDGLKRGRWLEIREALRELPENWDPAEAVRKMAVDPAPRARAVQRFLADEQPRAAVSNLLPVYSLKAAAGAYGGQQHVDPEGYVEVDAVPGGVKGAFVATVQGHSMEPLLRDGEQAIFRFTTGLPTGKVCLVQHRDEIDEETHGRYAVKRLLVDDRFTSDQLVQAYVTLQSVNPAFPPRRVPLGDDGFSVVAELVAVLDEGGDEE